MATVNKQAIAAAFGRAAATLLSNMQIYSARVLTPYWQCFHSVNTPTYWTRVVDLAG